jgi:menaquinone-dependent protoporphyrinogen IX oxidase
VKDIEHYHQTLINIKEQYQKNVKMFVKTTKQNLNHMHLACILVAFQTIQMEAKLVRLQADTMKMGGSNHTV